MDRFTIDPPLVAPPVDGLMDVEGLVDFKITSTEIDIHITRNFLAQLDLDLDPDLDILSYDYDKLKMHLRSEKQIQYERNYRSNNDLALLDLDLEIDLDHDVDLLSYACGKLVKRSRSEKQIQYERNYRSNQKRQRECHLREWLNGEQKRRRFTAVRDAVSTMPEGGYPTLAQRVCQLVFEENAILHDTYEMRALIELSKGLDTLDWKRGVLIPGCKKSDLRELTERRTTFVLHWERDC